MTANAAPKARRSRLGAQIGAPLPASFYDRPTEQVARDLLGAILECRTRDGVAAGRIVETEAYLGEHDLACHAAAGLTARTAPLYDRPDRVRVLHLRHALVLQRRDAREGRAERGARTRDRAGAGHRVDARAPRRAARRRSHERSREAVRRARNRRAFQPRGASARAADDSRRLADPRFTRRDHAAHRHHTLRRLAFAVDRPRQWVRLRKATTFNSRLTAEVGHARGLSSADRCSEWELVLRGPARQHRQNCRNTATAPLRTAPPARSLESANDRLRGRVAPRRAHRAPATATKRVLRPAHAESRTHSEAAPRRPGVWSASRGNTGFFRECRDFEVTAAGSRRML